MVPWRRARFMSRSCLLPCRRLYHRLFVVVSEPASVKLNPLPEKALFRTFIWALMSLAVSLPLVPSVITWKYTFTAVAAKALLPPSLRAEPSGALV